MKPLCSKETCVVTYFRVKLWVFPVGRFYFFFIVVEPGAIRGNATWGTSTSALMATCGGCGSLHTPSAAQVKTACLIALPSGDAMFSRQGHTGVGFESSKPSHGAGASYALLNPLSAGRVGLRDCTMIIGEFTWAHKSFSSRSRTLLNNWIIATSHLAAHAASPSWGSLTVSLAKSTCTQIRL